MYKKVGQNYGSNIWTLDSNEVCLQVEDRYRDVLHYLAEGFLICENEAAARAISEECRPPYKCVTLDGDVYDPEGYISGGYINPKKESIFQKYAKYLDLKSEFAPKEGERTQELEVLKPLLQQKEELLKKKSEANQKVERLNRLKQRLRELKASFLVSSVEDIKKQIELLAKQIEEDHNNKKKILTDIDENRKLVESLRKGGDVAKLMQKRIADIDQELARLEKEEKRYLKELCDARASEEKEAAQMEQLEKRISDDTKDVDVRQVTLAERKKYLESEEDEAAALEADIKNLKDRLREIEEKDDQLKNERGHIFDKVKKVEDDIEKNAAALKQLREEAYKARSVVGAAAEQEADAFQVVEEYEREDLKKLNKELAVDKEKYFELERMVNRDAERMQSHLEEQMKEVIKREQILKENKLQIETNLGKLDEKSTRSVLDCFENVNK